MSLLTQLGGPDRGANKYLHEWAYGIFISPLVQNRDARLHEFLRVTNFENGSSLFHGESDFDIQGFRDLTEDALIGIPNSAIQQIFIHWFKRVRNYCHLENLASGQIVKAKIPPADHITPTTCIEHAGRIIDVIDASLRIRWMKTLTPEEHGILAYGMDFGFPPFDLNCACDLEGIITGVNFDIAEPKRRIVTRTKWDRLNHIHYILSKGSPSEMSEGKFNDLMELMLRVSGELSENPDPRSKLERRIAEVLIERNRNMEAIGHLEKALSLKPKVGVKKLLERMKSE